MIVSISRKSAINTDASVVKPSSTGVKFEEVMEKQATKVPNDPFMAMEQLKGRLAAGQSIPAPELLLYQVRAGQFGMHVELVSKVGESVNVSLRKLQQQG